MKRFTLIILLLLSCFVVAQGDTKPWLVGGIGWSSDGQYIAVGTSAGVHIHASDDLSKLMVLDESFHITKVSWSNTDLRVAYDDYDGERVVIWNIETDKRSELQTYGPIEDVAWSPTDTFIAATAGRGSEIIVWHWETGVEHTNISLGLFRISDHALIGWSPDENYIALGGISNGIAIFNVYTGQLMDFIWHEKSTTAARWSPDGRLLAAGLSVWKINRLIHHKVIDEFAGDIVHTIPGGAGQSWHPDSTRIAVVQTEVAQDSWDFSGSGALIWDIQSGTGVKLPGAVFIWDVLRVHDVIEWSPDGNRLASISSDGRIVIWDASSYEILAEYDDYRSILDYYAENP